MKDKIYNIPKAVWFYPILFLLASLVPPILASWSDIRYGLWEGELSEVSIQSFMDFECCDCQVLADGTILVTGEDPWIWILGQDIYVSRVKIMFTEKTDSGLAGKLYYDTGNGFTEQDACSKIVMDENLIIDVRAKLCRLRVDFEGAESGEKICLDKIIINPQMSREQKWELLFRLLENTGLIFLLIISIYLPWRHARKRLTPIYWITLVIFFGLAVKLETTHLGGAQKLLAVFILWLFGQFFVSLLLSLSERRTEFFFFVSLLFMYLFWVAAIPFGGGPDEQMRYLVPQFIYNYGRLPVGTDPEIQNSIWGTSYGFTPTLCYVLPALFMKVGAFLGISEEMLYLPARLAGVAYSLGVAAICKKIGNLLFSDRGAWMLTAFIMLLPQYVFVTSYVNSDSFSMLGTAVLIWQVIKGRERKFPISSCIGIGVGVSLCLLSYYNAYGIILVLCIYCCIVLLSDWAEKKKGRKLFGCLGIMILTVTILAGWWFVRNYILYNGDFLGLHSSNASMELHAVDGMRPSQRQSPAELGMSVWQMLIKTNWLRWTLDSFIGVFGDMSIWLSRWVYNCYLAIILTGLAGNFLSKNKEEKVDLVFSVAMVTAVLATAAISLYYSWHVDFQPQGRYILPMLFPLSILIFRGYGRIACKKPSKWKIIDGYILLLMIMVGSFGVYLQVAVGY